MLSVKSLTILLLDWRKFINEINAIITIKTLLTMHTRSLCFFPLRMYQTLRHFLLGSVLFDFDKAMIRGKIAI